jgi:hypothetical protein
MTTATRRRGAAWLGSRAPVLGLVLGLALAAPARALVLDDRGEMRLGVRAYTAARFGSEQIGGEDDPLSWPGSGTGHLRQHRYFLEVKFDHDLRRLARETKGAAWLLGWFDPSKLRYTLQYRGEGEGIYDYGPDEFSDQGDKLRAVRLDIPDAPPLLSPRLQEEYIRQRVDKLRRIARQRHRFFLGYVDLEKGPVAVRIGRQVLAWGETDVFRLLDNINPLDDSFGGFLIALDERRLPLDMVRASYAFGSLGPLSDVFLEGFAATGNEVSTFPGIPPGSPWEPAGLGFPNPALRTVVDLPAREDIRGGARLVFTLRNVTATLAHYYTYLDVPGIQFRIPGAVQLPGESAPLNTARFGNEIVAFQRFPRVPVTGAAITFPVERFYTVVRSEAAYFQDEPMNRQGTGDSADSLCPAPGCPPGGLGRLRRANNTEGGLDPFVYPAFFDLTRTEPVWGRVLQRDTFNFALGLDINRFIRRLNPQQTFFISTQFFYKHVFDSPGDLVLPTPYRNIPVSGALPIIGIDNPLAVGCEAPNGQRRNCLLRPRLVHLDDDRFLHTLLVTTSYSGGRIVPSYQMFYDWQGAIAVQPGVTFVRDPFRFLFDYTHIAGPATGQIGAIRDRDNVRVQAEYVF